MSDKPTQGTRTDDLDLLLQQAFPGAPGLSGEFEQNVLGRARRRSKRAAGRTVLIIMGLYWSIAGLLAAWLLAAAQGEAATAATPVSIVVVLAVITLPVAGIAIMTGTAHIRLSELFIGTLRNSDEISGPPVAG